MLIVNKRSNHQNFLSRIALEFLFTIAISLFLLTMITIINKVKLRNKESKK
ncbi:hypothetical protein P343_14425 [Sporolactobacillus laevolacticus DSM 442]|uniref:Uncharacterized protein n=1 Tax=Sporolactobacillus laevolacticus DSM 442 TaxID=1395513 RepID=V6IUY6_9BACL|nr:hypothetical protein P343_14425 [Sporolactobacillus laevolacticus DSM 442]